MKKCCKCKIEKENVEFSKDKSRKDGLYHKCKSCSKIQNKKYYNLNKSTIINNKKEYITNRIKTDNVFKFSCNVRSLICGSFKRGVNQYKKNAKTEIILGCTIEEFRLYIENKFTEGMNWNNRSEWHLDHIKPIALAKSEEEIIKLNHYTNFQPLWVYDNILKSSKY
jgi:hypothetical protein